MRNTSTRAIAYLREQGFFCQSVEKWIPVAGNWKLGRRVDLFGIIDVLCIQGSALVGIQTFSGSTTTHMAKSKASKMLKPWLRTGNLFELWSWTKRVGKDSRGATRKLWRPRIIQIGLDDDGNGNRLVTFPAYIPTNGLPERGKDGNQSHPSARARTRT